LAKGGAEKDTVAVVPEMVTPVMVGGYSGGPAAKLPPPDITIPGPNVIVMVDVPVGVWR